MNKYDFFITSTDDECSLIIQPVSNFQPMRALRDLNREVTQRPDECIVHILVYSFMGDLWMRESMTVEQFMNSDSRLVKVHLQLLEAVAIISERGLLE